MLVFGHQARKLILRDLGMHHCAPCRATQPSRMVLRYRYFHYYYIFQLVTEQRFVRECAVCGYGEDIDSDAALSQLGGSPLTIWQRYGCLIWFAFMAVLIAALAIGGKMARGEW